MEWLIFLEWWGVTWRPVFSNFIVLIEQLRMLLKY